MAEYLLGYLSADFTEEDVEALRHTVEQLSASHHWSFKKPSFVDEVDTESATRPEDLPIRTVGVALHVEARETTALPGRPELERFINALCQLSRDRRLEFELQLGHTYVGEIRDGSMDRLLREGLLSGW